MKPHTNESSRSTSLTLRYRVEHSRRWSSTLHKTNTPRLTNWGGYVEYFLSSGLLDYNCFFSGSAIPCDTYDMLLGHSISFLQFLICRIASTTTAEEPSAQLFEQMSWIDITVPVVPSWLCISPWGWCTLYCLHCWRHYTNGTRQHDTTRTHNRFLHLQWLIYFGAVAHHTAFLPAILDLTCSSIGSFLYYFVVVWPTTHPTRYLSFYSFLFSVSPLHWILNERWMSVSTAKPGTLRVLTWITG